MRPEAFAEPRPQERVLRHTTEQIGDVAPMMPSLGVPEPQMVDQLVAVLKPVDSSVPEQIIAVPKISLPSRPLRAALAATQMVEQLVEVPTDVVLMETDTEAEEEEEEEDEERRTWIDDNVDAWALIRPPGRRTLPDELPPTFLPVAPPAGATAGPGRDINTGRRAQCLVRQWIHTLRQLEEVSWTNFTLFPRDWVVSGS